MSNTGYTTVGIAPCKLKMTIDRMCDKFRTDKLTGFLACKPDA